MTCYRDPDSRFALGSTDRAVALWTHKRLPFTDKHAPWQREMIDNHVGPAIRRLRFEPGEALSGLFACDERGHDQPDAENVCFYNWGTAPFALAPSRLLFERSFQLPPAGERPLAFPPRYFHRWAPRAPEHGWENWAEGTSAADWAEVPCTRVGSDSGQHVWAAMRRHALRVHLHNQTALDGGGAPFAVRLSLRAPRSATRGPVTSIKGLIDGALASLQRFAEKDADLVDNWAARLAGKLMWRGEPVATDDELRRFLTDDSAALLDGPPFDSKQLDPRDENCVAGDLLVEYDASLQVPLLSGSVIGVTPRLPDEAIPRA